MRTFLLTFLGGLAALVVFFVLIPLVLIMSFVPSGEPAKVQNAVLQIDLRETPNDQPASEPLAAAFSTEKLTPTQRAKMHESLQATYDRFTSIVAEGRKLPLQKVQEIARGRIWSGEDAQKNGLVNKTGDIVTALEEARALAGFKPEDKIDIRLNVHRTTPFELLTGSMMGGATVGGSSDLQIARSLAGIIGEGRAAMLIDQLRRISQPGNGAQVWSPRVMER